MFNFIKNIFIDKTISEKEEKPTLESSLTTNKLEKISEEYKKDEMNSIKDEYVNNTYQNNPETYSIENSIKVYKTDINNQICGCKDWNISRKQYSYNDPRRLCKHLIHLLDTRNLNEELNYFKENIEYYQSKSKGYKKQSYEFEKIISLLNKYKVEINFNNEWINIYTNNGLKYGFLYDQYGNIYWAKNLEKPNDYKKIEIELFNILFEHIISLTDNEKEKISNLINTNVFDISIKDKRDDYMVYCINCDSERIYDDDYEEAYIEDLYFHNIVVDNNQIFINLKSNRYLLERDYNLNKIESDKMKYIKLTELLESHKIIQE